MDVKIKRLITFMNKIIAFKSAELFLKKLDPDQQML